MLHVSSNNSTIAHRVAGLNKQAERDKLAEDFNLASFTPEPGMIYARVRAISARVNRNFDGFESAELKRAYRSFEGRPVFVNHENSNPERTRGIVVASAYREDNDDRYIELLIEVDAKAFPKLAQEITEGNIDSVSMGCEVESTICSYCGNEADDLGDFCEHILNSKGKTLSRLNEAGMLEDVLVYEICRGVNFFEISFVFDPADETALAQNVIDSRTASRKRRAYDERVAPQPVDTLADAGPCPRCGTDDYNGKQCRWCDYIAPPEQFQDPDLSKAKEQDLRDNSGTFDDEQHHQEDKTMPGHSDLKAALRQRRRKSASLPPTVDIKDGTYNIIQDGDDVHLENAADGDYVGVVSKPGGFSSADEVKAYALDALAEFAPDWDEVDEVSAGRRARRQRAASIKPRITDPRSWVDEDDEGVLYYDLPQGLGYYRLESSNFGFWHIEYQPPNGDPQVLGEAISESSASRVAAEHYEKNFAHLANRQRAATRHKRAALEIPTGTTLKWRQGDDPNGDELVAETDQGTYFYIYPNGGGKYGVSYDKHEGFSDPREFGTGYDTTDDAAEAAEDYWFEQNADNPDFYNKYVARRAARRNTINREVNMNHRTRAANRKHAAWEGDIYRNSDGDLVGSIEQDGDEWDANFGDDWETFDDEQAAREWVEEKAGDTTLTMARHRSSRRKQASELEPDEIPADFPVKPLATQAEIDAATAPAQDGQCGLWWDDAISTYYTPAPGGRCPFEAYHEYEDGYYASRRKRAATRIDWDDQGQGSFVGYADEKGAYYYIDPEGDGTYWASVQAPGTEDIQPIGDTTYPDLDAAKAASLAHAFNITARRKRAGLAWVKDLETDGNQYLCETHDGVYFVWEVSNGSWEVLFTDYEEFGERIIAQGLPSVEVAKNKAEQDAESFQRSSARRSARKKQASVSVTWSDNGNGGLTGETSIGGLEYYLEKSFGGYNVSYIAPDAWSVQLIEEDVPTGEAKKLAEDHAQGFEGFTTARRRKRAEVAPAGWTDLGGGKFFSNDQDDSVCIEQYLSGEGGPMAPTWKVTVWKDGLSKKVEGGFASLDEAVQAAQKYIGKGEKTYDRTARRKRATRRKRAALNWTENGTDSWTADGYVINQYGDEFELFDDEDNLVGEGYYTSLDAAKSAAEANAGKTARRKNAALNWTETADGFTAPGPHGSVYTVHVLAKNDVDVALNGKVFLTENSVENAKIAAERHADSGVGGIVARRRKRADADQQAAAPDERTNVNEESDVNNKNTDQRAAEPDERKDVTQPAETQPADATDSQYDETVYENQGGAPKASAIQAMALVDAMEEHGLIGNDERLAKFAEYEKTSANIVQDRLTLLAQVKEAGASAPTRTAKRSTVPRSVNRQRLNPSMGRVANSGPNTRDLDYLMNI